MFDIFSYGQGGKGICLRILDQEDQQPLVFIVIASGTWSLIHFVVRLCCRRDLQSFQRDVQVPGEGGKWRAWLETKDRVQSYSTAAISSAGLSWFVSILLPIYYDRSTLN